MAKATNSFLIPYLSDQFNKSLIRMN